MFQGSHRQQKNQRHIGYARVGWRVVIIHCWQRHPTASNNTGSTTKHVKELSEHHTPEITAKRTGAKSRPAHLSVLGEPVLLEQRPQNAVLQENQVLSSVRRRTRDDVLQIIVPCANLFQHGEQVCELRKTSKNRRRKEKDVVHISVFPTRTTFASCFKLPVCVRPWPKPEDLRFRRHTEPFLYGT